MKFIHTLQFSICLLGLACFSSSCHYGKVKPTVNGSADTASSHGDTLSAKIDFYTAKIIANPNEADAYWNRGRLEFLKKNFGPSLADLTKAIKLDSTKSDYFYDLALVEFRVDRTRESKDALITAVRLNPKNTSALLRLAQLYYYVKKYPEAMDLIDQAMKINPYLTEEYSLKALIFMDKHDTAREISSLQTVIEQDPKNFDAFIRIGILFKMQGNPIALSYFDNAMHLQPQNPESYYNKGLFYQSGRDYDNAIKAYTELLQIDSTYKLAYYSLGDIYNEYKKDYPKSIEYFNKAILCDSTFSVAYFSRGNSYEMLKQNEKALTDYAHAYRINPQFREAQSAYLKLLKITPPTSHGKLLN